MPQRTKQAMIAEKELFLKLLPAKVASKALNDALIMWKAADDKNVEGGKMRKRPWYDKARIELEHVINAYHKHVGGTVVMETKIDKSTSLIGAVGIAGRR